MADDTVPSNVDRVVHMDELRVTYRDSSRVEHLYPLIGQGPAHLATEEDLARDARGYTHPNLHRRVDPQTPPTSEDPRNQEVAPRNYQLSIQNVHSYRTTIINVHDEDSIDDETP